MRRAYCPVLLTVLLAVLLPLSTLAAQDDWGPHVAAAKLTLVEAMARGLQAAGKGAVFHAELELDAGKLVYSIDVAKGKSVWNVVFDARDGKEIERSEDPDDRSALVRACKVPLRTAIATALQRTPGAALEAQLLAEDGKPVITVAVWTGERLAVRIDGVSGAVLDAAFTDRALIAATAPALGLELEFAAANTMPTAALQEQIRVVTDGGPECWAGARVLGVRYRWPSGEWRQATLAMVPVALAGRSQPMSVVMVAGVDGQMAGGCALDHAAAVVEAWRGFGEQFAGKSLPTLAGAEQTALVRERLAALAAAEDAPGKAGHALAMLRSDMLRQSSQVAVIMAALANGEPVPQAAAKTVEQAFASMAARAFDLSPFLGKSTAAYAEQAKAAAAQIAELRSWQPDKTTGPTRSKALRRSCVACHALSVTPMEDLQTFCERKRAEIGLGDRPFVAGHDVLWDGPITDDVDHVAAGFRRAGLLIAAAQARPGK